MGLWVSVWVTRVCQIRHTEFGHLTAVSKTIQSGNARTCTQCLWGETMSEHPYRAYAREAMDYVATCATKQQRAAALDIGYQFALGAMIEDRSIMPRQQRNAAACQAFDQRKTKIDHEDYHDGPQNYVDDGHDDVAGTPELTGNPREKNAQNSNDRAYNDKPDEKLFNPLNAETHCAIPLQR